MEKETAMQSVNANVLYLLNHMAGSLDDDGARLFASGYDELVTEACNAKAEGYAIRTYFLVDREQGRNLNIAVALPPEKGASESFIGAWYSTAGREGEQKSVGRTCFGKESYAGFCAHLRNLLMSQRDNALRVEVKVPWIGLSFLILMIGILAAAAMHLLQLAPVLLILEALFLSFGVTRIADSQIIDAWNNDSLAVQIRKLPKLAAHEG